jgi:radical SAM-linked protein
MGECTLSKRQPDHPPPPPAVQRVRVRYAKRGRLRFTSHRDFARAFERALRRAGVPMAYSAGFSPHPKVSYLGAAPTGVASEAEYLEIALAERVEPAQLRATLDAALPPGLDILECVDAAPGSLADRIEASRWRVELPGVGAAELSAAVRTFLAQTSVEVRRLTKDGHRTLDARAAVVSAVVRAEVAAESAQVNAGIPADGMGVPALSETSSCAILDVVVRQVTPAVRPDDVLAALRAVADLHPTVAPKATRVSQGRLDDTGGITDPLGPDRAAALAARESAPGPVAGSAVGQPA